MIGDDHGRSVARRRHDRRKNEEQNLPLCLASLDQLRPLLGTVIVHDTGSSDGTVALAQRWGARVHRGYWDDDFARARNVAVDMATAPWALTVDADEIVVVNVDRLAEALHAAHESIDALVGSMAVATGHTVTSLVDSVRVFRPARAHYRNRVHENVVPRDSERRLVAERLSVDALVVSHFGYVSGDPMTRRGERNVRIAELQVEALAPEDADARVEALLSRGRSYLLNGQPGKGFADMKAAWETDSISPFRIWAGEELVERMVEAGQLSDAEELLAQLADAGTDAQFCRWVLARIRLLQQAPHDSLQLLRLVNKPQRALGRVDSWGPVLRLRALAAAACGERDEALAAGISALAGHGCTSELGRLLIALWHPGDPALLGGLLAQAGTRYSRSVCDELLRAGVDGQLAADAYMAAVADAAAQTA